MTSIKLLTCVGVAADLPLLGQFADHYLALGVAPADVHVVLNADADDHPGFARAEAILAERDIAAERWVAPYTSIVMWEKRRELQARVAGPDDWVISADVDELHDYPAPLRAVIRHCDASDADVVQGPMIDRVARDGALDPVDPDRPLAEQFPICADVMCPLGKVPGERDAAGTTKMMLYRGDVLPGLGGHNPKPDAPRPPRYLLGRPLSEFPRAKEASFRFALPFRVNHYKWHAGVAATVTKRMATPGASPAGTRYGGRLLSYFERSGGRVRLGDVAVEDAASAPSGGGDWQAAVADLRRAAEATGRLSRPAKPMAEGPVAGEGWSIRQLTFGTRTGRCHAHSYYDLPVYDPGGRRLAAYRTTFAERWMTPDDEVAVGIVPVDAGGFAPIATTRAWSWQQGPMAQWLPGGRRMVWNDRDGERFVARSHDVGAGTTRTIDRPIYAVSPCGGHALGVNMARLDAVRPGYGYVGGGGADLGANEPVHDGVWRIGLDGAPDALVLSTARAVAFMRSLPPPPPPKNHGPNEGGPWGGTNDIYWFNHVKFSPSGRRFTAKLRWRDAGLKGPWGGNMGVSITCGTDGSDPRLLAAGTSHVIWLDDERLYLWHQSERRLAVIRDEAPVGRTVEVVRPDIFDENVHIRHVPDDPARWIHDVPYKEEVSVRSLDRRRGASQLLARFGNHRPPQGPFRRDLDPVPTRQGAQVFVTSLHDGGRQLYAIERDGSS